MPIPVRLSRRVNHIYSQLCRVDTIFSEISLAPFDTDELQRALNIVDYLNGDICSYIVLGMFFDPKLRHR